MRENLDSSKHETGREEGKGPAERSDRERGWKKDPRRKKRILSLK